MSREECPDPGNPAIAAHYTRFGSATPPPSADADDPQMQFLAKHVPAARDVRILEAGCGNARYSLALHRMGYRNLCAVDLFETIALADIIDYRRSNVAGMPWPDASFDFIVSWSVIHYLADPGVGLGEFRRLLRPGGVAVFSAHTRYSLFSLDRVCRRAAGRARHLEGLRFLSSLEYSHLARRAGLDVIECDGFRFMYYPSRFAERVGKKIHRTLLRGAKLPAARGHSDRLLRSLVAYHSLHAVRHPVEAS